MQDGRYVSRSILAVGALASVAALSSLVLNGCASSNGGGIPKITIQTAKGPVEVERSHFVNCTTGDGGQARQIDRYNTSSPGQSCRRIANQLYFVDRPLAVQYNLIGCKQHSFGDSCLELSMWWTDASLPAAVAREAEQAAIAACLGGLQSRPGSDDLCYQTAFREVDRAHLVYKAGNSRESIETAELASKLFAPACQRGVSAACDQIHRLCKDYGIQAACPNVISYRRARELEDRYRQQEQERIRQANAEVRARRQQEEIAEQQRARDFDDTLSAIRLMGNAAAPREQPPVAQLRSSTAVPGNGRTVDAYATQPGTAPSGPKQASRDRVPSGRGANEESVSAGAQIRSDSCWDAPPSCLQTTSEWDKWGEFTSIYRNVCQANVYVRTCNEMKNGSWDCGDDDIRPGATKRWQTTQNATGRYKAWFVGAAKPEDDWICAGRAHWPEHP